LRYKQDRRKSNVLSLGKTLPIKTILLVVLSIHLYGVAENKVLRKDVAFLNIAEDGWLHVEAGPVNSPPTQQQPGTLQAHK
jgi:hypothetical protein